MKNKLVIFLLIISLFVLFSCVPDFGFLNSSDSSSGSVDANKIGEVFHDMSALQYYKANISDKTAAVGLKSGASSSRALDSSANTVLVKQDKGSSTTEEVDFTVVKDTDENGDDVLGFDGVKINVGDTLKQGDIPGNIDKIYVTDNYTFISYITVDIDKLRNAENLGVTNNSDGSKTYYGSITIQSTSECSESMSWSFSSQSSEIYLNYSYNSYGTNRESSYYSESVIPRAERNDEQAPGENTGILVYDTYGYSNSKFRESFIIDNSTGLIYSVGDMSFGMKNGVAIEKSMGPVEITSGNDGTLVIDQLVANKNIYIEAIFKDKYNQYYVYNDSLNAESGNVMYFTKAGEYIPTSKGVALHIDGPTSEYRNYYISSISEVSDNFSERKITKQDYYSINYCPTDTYYSQYDALQEYNNSNGVWRNGNDGYNFTFCSIENGVLTGVGNNIWNLEMIYMDISDYKTYLFNYSAGSGFLLPLKNGYYLAGNKDTDSNNLYTLSVVNTNSFDINKYYEVIFCPDGTREDNPYNKYDLFRMSYADLVYTSNEWVSQDEKEYDFEVGIWIDREHLNYEYYKYKEGYTEESVRQLWDNGGGVELFEKKVILSGVTVKDIYSVSSAFDCEFQRQEVSGTTTYRIVEKGSNNFEAVESSKVVAEKKTVTLLPINS